MSDNELDFEASSPTDAPAPALAPVPAPAPAEEQEQTAASATAADAPATDDEPAPAADAAADKKDEDEAPPKASNNDDEAPPKASNDDDEEELGDENDDKPQYQDAPAAADPAAASAASTDAPDSFRLSASAPPVAEKQPEPEEQQQEQQQEQPVPEAEQPQRRPSQVPVEEKEADVHNPDSDSGDEEPFTISAPASTNNKDKKRLSRADSAHFAQPTESSKQHEHHPDVLPEQKHQHHDEKRLSRVDSAHFAQPTKSSSFKQRSRSDSVGRERSQSRNRTGGGSTPFGQQSDAGASSSGNVLGQSGSRPAFKPSSRVPDLLASARDLAEQMKSPPKKHGPPGPLRPPPTTNLFHQLHVAIFQRPPIRASTRNQPVSARGTNGGGSDPLGNTTSLDGSNGGATISRPYSLIPPAAKNAANSILPAAAPPGYGMNVSALNTGITSSVYASRKPPSSVLSILCVTGDADADATAGDAPKDCLRVIPCSEDHRSVAVEHVVPIAPRDGALFQGSFLSEDSTFLSRQFRTFDGVAAFREDWEVLADLIGGDFLAGAVAGGLCRSSIMIVEAGPDSQAVADSFVDGAHPFIKKVASVLHSVCTAQELRQKQKEAREQQARELREEEQRKKKEQAESGTPLLAASPILSSPRRVGAAGKRTASSSPRKLVNGGASPRRDASPGAAARNPENKAPNLATVAPDDPLAFFFLFDHIGVGAVDIDPGADPATGGDVVYDALSGKRIELIPKRRHVPKKFQAVSCWVVPPEAEAVACATPEEVAETCSRIMGKPRTAGPQCHRIVWLKLQKSDASKEREGADPIHQLSYEPTVMFAFLSPLLNKRHAQSSSKSKDPVARAIARDHRELFLTLEHVAKFDGVGKDALLMQPVSFDGALVNLLSSNGWLRADVCHTLMMGAVRAFSEEAEDCKSVIADVDRVKALPVHPRASAFFAHHGMEEIVLPPLAKNVAAQQVQRTNQPSPPKGKAKKGAVSPRR